MIGNPGVGKSFLAKCIAYGAKGTRKNQLWLQKKFSFAECSNIFDDTTAATAIDDHLVYNSEILIMEGQSYRKRI